MNHQPRLLARLAVLVVLALLVTTSVGAAQVTISWIGKDGAWEVPTNWQTNEKPPVKRAPINGDNIQPMANAKITMANSMGTQNLDRSTVVQRVATSARFVQTGGTLNVNAFLLTSTKAAVAKGHINYELRGGTLYADYNSTFTWDNNGDRATRFVQTGGSAKFGATARHGLNMAHKSSTQRAHYELRGGSFDAGYLRLGSGGANQTAEFVQSAGTTATLRGTLSLGTVAGTTGRSIYHLDGGTLTMSATSNPFAFTQPGAPAYFNFDGGVLNLRGTWNFAGLTAIPNSDFRVGGTRATATTLTFQKITISGTTYTRISGCAASIGSYGTGLTGKNGIPTLTASAAPKGGTNITINASNSSGSATQGMVLVGIAPLSVDFLGGKLLVVPLVQTLLPVPARGLVLPYSVPTGICQTFYLQVLQRDTAAVRGVAMTPGLRFTLGN